ncbi:MAG TPA: hypothetical protein VE860_24810 [Chthoniobacterales bacterium]|nr:hypothetical protein [Chthoniobacterales bacterium]
MPITTGARRPVLMPAVRTGEKIGAQYRCTTGGKMPEHPQFVFGQLEQWEQNGQKSAQNAAQC